MAVAKITVYLPDELAAYAKSRDWNVSSLVQEALRRQQILETQAQLVAEDRAAGLLDERKVSEWQERLTKMKSSSTAAI